MICEEYLKMKGKNLKKKKPKLSYTNKKTQIFYFIMYNIHD